METRTYADKLFYHMNGPEKALMRFLMKYPDQWHSYATDKETLRVIGFLYLYRGMGIRGLELSRGTMQMRLNKYEFNIGVSERHKI